LGRDHALSVNMLHRTMRVSNPDLPESKEAYDVIARFFDRHLGRYASRTSG
jgi:hypothetical protein